MRILPVFLALALTALAADKMAEPSAWLKDLASGKAEAAKSGKPIFLVAIWPPGT